MDIANWLRKKLNRPVKFNLDRALMQARADAHADLAGLEDPLAAAVVEGWQHIKDPATDDTCCDSNYDLMPRWDR